MKKIIVIAIASVAFVLAALILASGYKYKYKSQDTIVVTGLGEEEFESDLIVWRGCVTAKSNTIVGGYALLEENKKKVSQYIKSNGVPDSSVVFMFVNANTQSEPIYQNGQYVGQRNTGYELRQDFSVESTNVESIENVSREISSLLAQGVTIESWSPEYYYTKLSDLKMRLIKQATTDGRDRAANIATNAGSKLKSLKSARLGVFQITGANSNEALSAGGAFNTDSKNKKARITIRLEYHVK